jgi:hypothetical protein
MEAHRKHYMTTIVNTNNNNNDDNNNKIIKNSSIHINNLRINDDVKNKYSKTAATTTMTTPKSSPIPLP